MPANEVHETAQILSGRKVWRVRPPVPPDALSSIVSAGYPPLLAQLLYNRGVEGAHQAQSFLSLEPVSHQPMALPGMEAAIRRLRQALEGNERIAVFGDFDVDGVTATALLTRALKPLGNEVLAYIPHRVEEGHGLSLRAVETLAQQKVNLLITVDCGITSYQEIDAAAGEGIDTIVTDHHLAPEGPPNACAVVNPRLPESLYPFPHLTGAGLVLKLVQALYQSMGRDDTDLPQPLLSLAALGTVADVAPLVDENRSIVRQGLQELGRAPSAGIRALMRSARLEGQIVDAEAIGWVLSPRLNAPGRIDRADTSYELLVTDSEERATVLAAILEQQNRERQRLTSEANERAKALIELEPLVMVGDPTFSPGIIGLVAGKLAEEFNRPAVVLSLGSEVSRGSCRSIPEFNMGAALYQVASKVGGFIRHGGHAQAAGFTIATEKLPALRTHLVALARESLGDQPSRPTLDIDLELPLGSLPRDIYRIIGVLAPFGEGNPAPTFLSRNVQLAEVRKVGSGGEHLRLKLRDGGAIWDAMAFRQAHSLQGAAKSADVVYTIEINRWRGQETLRLNIMDLRTAD